MRRSHIAAMELFSPLENGPFELEPFEVAWAREAISFVYITEIHGNAEFDLRVQISIDGQRWIDFGPQFDTMSAVGGYFLQLTHFGTWLRLVGEIRNGPDDHFAMLANFYWDFKE